MSDQVSDPRGGETVSASSSARGAYETGMHIGPYRVLGLLGEGGLGIVYHAEQTKPVRRRVALKVIKPGMDTRAVIARFEAERQALALMDHPSVARVFEAGTTEQGLPYFVMEYVPGVPITQHCDRHKLSVPQRLELFIQVCEAVQHAHQKGVIHRDIKPKNILVSISDGKAVPKVIDFGVAKAISQPLTERTLFTEQGQLIGTPSYMSPEQAEGTAQDVDTRSDIYSLGVVLYELLTGRLPLDPESFRRAAFDQVLRIIREVEPPKPSTKLSSVISAGGDDSTGTARNRHTDPRTLTRQLRGDLDWITMKALEKDRTRRYASATDLAADIRRHMNHQPVVAGPPSAAYRVRKFVRRNRGVVIAAVVVFAVLVAGVAGTTWQAVAATRQRDRAVAAERQQSRERQRAERARAKAEAEANKAVQIQQYLQNMLASMGVNKKKAALLSVREMLDQAVNKVQSEFADQGEIRAALLLTLGRTYSGLGIGERAEQTLHEALDIRRELFGDESLEVAEVFMVLGGMLPQEDPWEDADIEQAREYARQALEIRENLLGRGHEFVLEAGAEVAGLTWLSEDYEHSLETLQWVMPALLNLSQRDELPTEWGAVLGRARKLWEAGRREEAVAVSQVHVEGIIEQIRALWANGEHEAARELLRRNYRPFLVHPLLRKWMPGMLYGASVTKVQGSTTEVPPGVQEPFLREAIDVAREVHGNEHRRVADFSLWLGYVLTEQGKFAEAESLFRDALLIFRKAHGDEHPDVAASLYWLAHAQIGQGKLSEAEPLLTEALATRRKLWGDEHELVAWSQYSLGRLRHKQGALADAERLLREALAMRKKLHGDEHEDVVWSLYRLAWVLMDQGNPSDAEALFEQAVAMAKRTLPEGDPDIDDILTRQGLCLTALERHVEAEEALLEAHKTLLAADDVEHETVLETVRALVALYDTWHAAEPDAGHDAKAAQWRAKLPPESETQPSTTMPAATQPGKKGRR